MAGPVLYLHFNRDGAIFSVRSDGAQGWLSIGDLDRVIYDLSIRGGSVMFSADKDPSLSSMAASALRRLDQTGIPSRELPRPHPAVAAGLPEGTTAAMLFAHRGELDLLGDLLDRGAAVDARDEGGTTALMYACSAGQVETVELLIARGAEVDARDTQAATPLMFAAQSGDAGVVRVLLDAGADVNASAADGLTPVEAARSSGHYKIVSLLTRRGGER
jgi:ankyrin repeat protein